MSLASAMRTVTLNAAFLQEIKEVNEELWHTLEDLSARCGDPSELRQELSGCVKLVASLRDQLAMHFALEEAYGYFDDPAEVAPQLCAQVAGLREEHIGLYRQIVALAEQAEELQRCGAGGPAVATWARVFAGFEQALRGHEARENDLILEQYDGDIGVGD